MCTRSCVALATGPPTKEIELAPEMTEAEVSALRSSRFGFEGYETIAESIYKAMNMADVHISFSSQKKSMRQISLG